MRALLDAGFLMALEDARDQWHECAKTYWQSLRLNRASFLSTTLVLAEGAAFFNRRGMHVNAVKVGRQLMTSRYCDLRYVDEALYLEGWRYFVARPDTTYSLTDCVSFVLMARERIREALTFDDHFTQAGFLRLPA